MTDTKDLAIAASGIAVGKSGTATVSADELRGALEMGLDHGGVSHIPLETAISQVRKFVTPSSSDPNTLESVRKRSKTSKHARKNSKRLQAFQKFKLFNDTKFPSARVSANMSVNLPHHIVSFNYNLHQTI